jgi:5-methylcytosine-specific restriction enzyme A
VRFLRPCPGCKIVLIASPARRCPGCTRGYEHARGSAAERGYDARHARWRRAVLATYPNCVDCGADGKPGDHADHVVPLAAGGDWSIENGRRRCGPCHSRKTVLQDGGFGNARVREPRP